MFFFFLLVFPSTLLNEWLPLKLYYLIMRNEWKRIYSETGFKVGRQFLLIHLAFIF